MDSFSLLEFNTIIKSTLEDNLESSYWIVAEIGEMNVNQKGHCYMDLIEKKDSAIVAKSRATIWSYTFSNLNNWFANMTGAYLKPGIKVMVNASIQYHEVYGFSLNIKDIDPNFTIGERERKKQETIKKLEDDGVIDMNKALTLPLVPQKIAIISSESAAGYGDFVHQLDTNPNGYAINHDLHKAVMQGNKAVASIIMALHAIFEREESYDLVAIIRGGGAKTDLDCFDEYELCSHLAQFPLPIVTGIGHERDNTIADMVAHTQLKTPTAVAEFLISGFMNFESSINEHFNTIGSRANEKIAIEQQALLKLTHDLRFNSSQLINNARNSLSKTEELTRRLPFEIIRMKEQKLNLLQRSVIGFDPQRILDRGYSITLKNGKVIGEKNSPKKGDVITTKSKIGTFESKIT